MAYLGSWKIDDYLPIPANTHRFSTGAAYDASAITYRIYEDETDTEIVAATAMTKFDSKTGFYLDREQLTAASGFEKGKCYTVYIEATVDSVAGTMSHTFQLEAEVDANAVSNIGSGVITATAIADDAITAAKLNTGALTADAFAADALVAATFATDAISADALAADAVDELHDEVVEGSVTFRQAVRLILAALTGKVSGAGTGTVVIRDIGDTKDRIVATVTAEGNRTAVGTRDGS